MPAEPFDSGDVKASSGRNALTAGVPNFQRAFVDVEAGNAYPQSEAIRQRLSEDLAFLGAASFELPIDSTKAALLQAEDTDKDGRITVDDSGPKTFTLQARSPSEKRFDVRGTYFLANLLQELTISHSLGLQTAIINGLSLVEDPVKRISRRINDMFWTNLIRKMDRSLIRAAAMDPKDWTGDPRPRIYVPSALRDQYEYYAEVARKNPELRLDVQYLPADGFTPEYVRDLNDEPGLLALQMRKEAGVPHGLQFVVPGGRFNELYGWDSYFSALGLLEAGRTDIVKDIVLNFCFEIEHYGCILNANRSYYLNRSQPPFLSDLVTRTFSKIGNEADADEFLRAGILSAVKEYNRVWLSTPRYDPVTCLSRYRSAGIGVPPEVEETGYDFILTDYAKKYGMNTRDFIKAYNSGAVQDSEVDDFFRHDRAVRESGHDTSYRVERCAADLATIDLNALLYKYEMDIAHTIQAHFDDRLEVPEASLPLGNKGSQIQSSLEWLRKAELRQKRVDEYLWNQEDGMYYDFNTESRKQSRFESVTTLWPLWSGLASNEQAALLVAKALPKFEEPGGLACTTKRSCGPEGPNEPSRQWDYPFGWAPHQIMAWDGLTNYGYKEEAERLAYRWLRMVTQTAVDYNGAIVEKYNVTCTTGQHKVNAEYGNQGCNFQGLAREGFGWTNASYSYGLNFVSERLKKAMAWGVPYENL